MNPITGVHLFLYVQQNTCMHTTYECLIAELEKKMTGYETIITDLLAEKSSFESQVVDLEHNLKEAKKTTSD